MNNEEQNEQENEQEIAEQLAQLEAVSEPSRLQRVVAGLGGGIRSAALGVGSTVSRIIPTAPPATGGDDLADLFKVPQPEDHDIFVDDLLEIDEPEDVSDLLVVTNEDIMGKKPKPKAKLIRTSQPYPPAGIGGIQ